MVLVFVSSTAFVAWTLWRLLLPCPLRWRARSYYFQLKARLHDFAASNKTLRNPYLRANVTWHSRISWKPKFYWRKLVSALGQDIKHSTVSRAIGLIAAFTLSAVGLYVFLKEPSYFPSVGKLLANLKKATDVTPEVRLDGTFFLMLVGLPSLFLLWAYRDANSLLTIENQRKDTNLKEFQQLQMWACGVVKDAPDSEEGENQRTTLRIAALHQLSRFLYGEHGESFVQPTFEMFKALLEPHVGFAAKLQRELDSYDSDDSQFKGLARAEAVSVATQEVIDSFETPSWAMHVQKILLKGGARLGVKGFDWSDICFFSLELRSAFLPGVRLLGSEIRGAYLFSCALPGANFSFAQMQGARVINCDLQEADFEYADLTGTSFANVRLQGALMSHCKMEGVSFRGGMLASVQLGQADAKFTIWKRADLRGASFFEADLTGARLLHAKLNGANLGRAKLAGADLRGIAWDESTVFTDATYDGSTLFGEWDEDAKQWTNSDEQKQRLVFRGLREQDIS